VRESERGEIRAVGEVAEKKNGRDKTKEQNIEVREGIKNLPSESDIHTSCVKGDQTVHLHGPSDDISTHERVLVEVDPDLVGRVDGLHNVYQSSA
jgi:hypothetical protein